MTLVYNMKLMDHKAYVRANKMGVKKAPTALNLYFSDKIKSLDTSTTSARQQFQVVHAKWSKEPDSIKSKYEKMAEQAKAELESEKKELMPTLPKPKRAKNAYNLYYSEVFPDVKKKK